MDFNAIIAKRRSVRAFKTKAAGWRDIVEAVDAARTIPLSGNTTTLRFLIVMEPDKIAKLAEFAEQNWIADASIVVAVCSDETLLEKAYGERGRVYSRQQAGAAIQTFLLAIINQGLGACWVGAYNDSKVRRLLDIPENIQIEALIPVGYAKAQPTPKYKRSLKNLMYWERWGKAEIPSFFREHSLTEERR